MLKIYARRPIFQNRPNGERVIDPDSRGQPFGVILAKEIEGNKILVGWSQCSKADRFSKKIATELAENRMESEPIVMDFDGKFVGDIGILDDTWRPEMKQTMEKCVYEINRKPSRYV